MIGLSETTLLALGITFSTFAPQSTPSASLNDILSSTREYSYTVQSGDSLGSIARDKYGSEAYWTTIWNDNKTLVNPNVIHSDLELTLRVDKPLIIEESEREYASEVVQIVQSEFVQAQSTESSATQSAVPVGDIDFEQQSVNGPLTEEQLTFLGNCEAGMNPATNTGNSYYGAFQFAAGTWNSMNTGYERADLAPLEVQKEAVQRLLARSSIFTQFPACARNMLVAGLI